MSEWRVYAVGDYDWWMGRNVDEVKVSVVEYYGDIEDEPRELTANEMQKLRYVLDYSEITCECGAKINQLGEDWRFNGREWEHHHGYPIGHVAAPAKISFAEQLQRRIKAGPKVELFATTEF